MRPTARARGSFVGPIGGIAHTFLIGSLVAGSVAVTFVLMVASAAVAETPADRSNMANPGILSWMWDFYRASIESLFGWKRGSCAGMYNGLNIGVLTPRPGPYSVG